jgi:hypothetical protein
MDLIQLQIVYTPAAEGRRVIIVGENVEETEWHVAASN